MMFESEKKSLSAVIALAAAFCIAAQPFERYQTVIDRKPFGPEPVNFDPEAAPGSAAAASRTSLTIHIFAAVRR